MGDCWKVQKVLKRTLCRRGKGGWRCLALLILLAGSSLLYLRSRRVWSWRRRLIWRDPDPATLVVLLPPIPQANKDLPPFLSNLDAFPDWSPFLRALQKEDKTALAAFSSRLLLRLSPYLLLEPKVKVNASCIPPILSLPKCGEKGPHLKPLRVGILIKMGFDLDVLEMYLNEVGHLVDKIFILESRRSYSGVKKRLLWEAAESQPRFAKFGDKVVQFTLDDADALKGPEPKGLEDRGAMWDKFRKWNAATGFFRDDDLLGFGESSQIPSRSVINYLKHCRMASDPVVIGSWSVFGKADRTLKGTTTEGKGLEGPTFWSLKKAWEEGVKRNPGSSSSPSFLLGGTVIRDYSYLPVALATRLTRSQERPFELIRSVTLYPSLRGNLSLLELESYYSETSQRQDPKVAKEDLYLINLKDSSKGLKEKEVYYLPWFYECNKARYPALEGGHDSRLD